MEIHDSSSNLYTNHPSSSLPAPNERRQINTDAQNPSLTFHLKFLDW